MKEPRKDSKDKEITKATQKWVVPELRLETLEFTRPGREVEMAVWGRSTVRKGTEAIPHIQHYGHSKMLGKAGA